MNRIDRLAAIVTFIQSRKLVTARQIAERFEISPRTVYRDVNALYEAGIPLAGEAGIGYSIEPGYHLPPVMFTREEASAMITAGKMTEKMTDISMDKHYTSAMEKVKSVMRQTDKVFLENLESKILVLYNPKTTDEFPNCFMSPVQKAVSASTVLSIEYFSQSKNETTARDVEPIGTCFYSGRWHLLAWCRLRNQYRDFRIDRIKNLVTKPEIFSTKHPPMWELLQKMGENSTCQQVILRFDKDFFERLSDSKYYYGYIDHQIEQETIVATFMTDSLYWVENWLLTIGKNVEVVTPIILINSLKNRILELQEKYC
jgi:predicted DNA-binding transcriptional regulator YafY